MTASLMILSDGIDYDKFHEPNRPEKIKLLAVWSLLEHKIYVSCWWICYKCKIGVKARVYKHFNEAKLINEASLWDLKMRLK